MTENHLDCLRVKRDRRLGSAIALGTAISLCWLGLFLSDIRAMVVGPSSQAAASELPIAGIHLLGFAFGIGYAKQMRKAVFGLALLFVPFVMPLLLVFDRGWPDAMAARALAIACFCVLHLAALAVAALRWSRFR